MDKGTPCDAKQKDMVNILKSMIGALQSPKNSICFEYFTDKFDRFFSLTSHFVPGDQLTSITQLMLILFEKLCDEYQLYEYYFLQLVEYCTLPLKTETINDVLPYRDDIRDFFSACAYMLGSTQNMTVIRKILQLFIIEARQRTHYHYKNQFFVDCLISSKFPEIVSELLRITEFHLYFEYLNVLEHILVTESECLEFIKYNLVDIISKRLMCNVTSGLERTDEDLKSLPLPMHLDLSQRILWSLLKAYLNSTPEYREKVLLEVSPEGWRIAKNVLVMLCYNQHKRKQRNMFLLLYRIIWDQYPFEDYTRTSNEVLYLGFITEVPCKDPNSWLSNVQFIPDDLDLEFKIFVMSTLCATWKLPVAAEALRFTNAVPSLMIILDTTQKVIWTPMQREKLMCYALLGLQNALSVIVTDFLVCKGPEKLLQVTEQILSSTLPFHLLFPTLLCINRSLSIPDYDNSEMIKRYLNNNARNVLSKLFQIYLQTSPLSKVNQNGLSVIFCILRKLTDETSENCEEIINSCNMLLKEFLKVKASPAFLHPQLLLAIMTYLWDSLICTRYSLDYFISSGGIYTILDVIEQFPLAIKLIGLSMICDFCEKDVTLACLLTWRGKDGCTIIPFLLNLYRQQTIFDEQQSNIKAHLKDMESNQAFNFKGIDTTHSSTVLRELLGTCKPKICALFHILACSPQASITNESYLISSTDFSFVDEVTAVEAEHYFNLKFGEAWIDVEDYFRTTGCDLVAFDKALIAYHLNQHEILLRRILSQQINYQLQDKVKETKLEHALYKRIQGQLLSESLDDILELKKIAMSANRQFKLEEYNRMINKLRQNEMKYGFGFHKTLFKTINIFRNKISLQSDTIIDPNPKEPPPEVSPSRSFPEDIVNTIMSSALSTHGSFHYKIGSKDKTEAIVDDY